MVAKNRGHMRAVMMTAIVDLQGFQVQDQPEPEIQHRAT